MIPADKTARYRPLLEAIHRGREMSFNLPSDMALQRAPQLMMPAETGRAGTGTVSTAAPQVHVAVLNDRQDLQRFLEESAGENAIVRIVNRRRIDIGLDT